MVVVVVGVDVWGLAGMGTHRFDEGRKAGGSGEGEVRLSAHLKTCFSGSFSITYHSAYLDVSCHSGTKKGCSVSVAVTASRSLHGFYTYPFFHSVTVQKEPEFNPL